MEIRRLGEPLLRSQALPLLSSFLAPSIPSSWRLSIIPRRSRVLLPSCSNQSQYGFHSTSPKYAQSSADSTADLDFLNDAPEQKPPRPSPDSPASRRISGNAKIDSLLNSTLNIPPRKPYTPPTETSASMVDASYKASQYYNIRERGTRSPGSFSRDMAFPSNPDANESTNAGDALENYQPLYGVPFGEARRMKRSIQSRPSIGRTVEIDPERGPDFGRALRSLEIQCAVNRVRADQQRQRFHERPGMKRKRLKSERWRKLFKESFRATVGRVKEMRRKGW